MEEVVILVERSNFRLPNELCLFAVRGKEREFKFPG